MKTYFQVMCLSGRWYVIHVRTSQIVPASAKQAWHESEAAARAAAL